MNNYKTFLSLGSNLGDREGHIEKAKLLIAEIIAPIIASSSIYETEPWGDTNQGDYINQIIKIKSNLDPQLLLENLLKIERTLGRIRTIKNGPRTIDIDILIMEDLVISSPSLTIPHPRMTNRKFILIPFVELEADYIHPILNKSMEEILILCKDNSNVKKLTTHEIKSE